MSKTTRPTRRRVNKKYLFLWPESEHFPFGGISIALLELGLSGIQEAGGARYYDNLDGTLTMEMKALRDEKDPTKPLSHIYQEGEWDFLKPTVKKV